MALGYYVNAGTPLLVAMDLLGVDLTEEQRRLIEQDIQEKAELANQLQQQREQGVGWQPEDPKDKPDPYQEKKALDDTHLKIGRELDIWRRKCESAIKKGRPADSIDFIPVEIPAEVYYAVSEKLTDCADLVAVKSIFTTAMLADAPTQPIPVTNELAGLVQELKRRNDIEIWRGYP